MKVILYSSAAFAISWLFIGYLVILFRFKITFERWSAIVSFSCRCRFGGDKSHRWRSTGGNARRLGSVCVMLVRLVRIARTWRRRSILGDGSDVRWRTITHVGHLSWASMVGARLGCNARVWCPVIWVCDASRRWLLWLKWCWWRKSLRSGRSWI